MYVAKFSKWLDLPLVLSVITATCSKYSDCVTQIFGLVSVKPCRNKQKRCVWLCGQQVPFLRELYQAYLNELAYSFIVGLSTGSYNIAIDNFLCNVYSHCT